MKLTDMKLKKTKKDDKLSPVSGMDGDMYPYGLRIRFDEGNSGKIKGLSGASVGDEVSVEAMARVVSIRSEKDTSGNTRTSIELQIEKIGVETCMDDQAAFDEGADDSSD